MAREIARKVRERNGVIAHVMEAEAVVAIGCCSKRNPLTNGESGNTDVCRLAAARRGNSKWVGIKTLRPNSHGHSQLKKLGHQHSVKEERTLLSRFQRWHVREAY